MGVVWDVVVVCAYALVVPAALVLARAINEERQR